MSVGFTGLLASIISNRQLYNIHNSVKLLKHRIFRVPSAIGIGAICAAAFDYGLMSHVYDNDIKELGLDKYYSLDLDSEMMRKDLAEMGINVQDDRAKRI